MLFSFAGNSINDNGNAHWQFDKTTGNEEIKWLLLLTLAFELAPQGTIGINDKGFWILKWENATVEIIDSRDKCFHLLGCLEKDRNDFYFHLKENIARQKLNVALATSFPVVELIKFALASGKRYWAEKAVDWMHEQEMDNELESVTNKFIEDNHFSQKARHQAFKILKRWQKHL